MMGWIAASGFIVALGLLTSAAHGQGSAEALTTAAAERSEFHEIVHLDGVIEAVQQSTVSAQTSGTVLSLPYDVDDSVAAGELIVQLEDSEQRSRLRQAQAGLEEAEAALLDAGQRFERIKAVYERGLASRQEFDQTGNNLAAARARVTLADGRVLETGEMTFYPYANPQTHTFRLRMRLSEPNGSLFPGMLVKVGVPVASREALWVPASSLIQRSELRAVFVLDEQDRPRLRQVRTGMRDNGRLEILAGLSEGDRVVTNPSELVGSDRLNPAAESGMRGNL
jgi:multidrug efflux pump subunit AcrA (membrane-fusion protein)